MYRVHLLYEAWTGERGNLMLLRTNTTRVCVIHARTGRAFLMLMLGCICNLILPMRPIPTVPPFDVGFIIIRGNATSNAATFYYYLRPFPIMVIKWTEALPKGCLITFNYSAITAACRRNWRNSDTHIHVQFWMQTVLQVTETLGSHEMRTVCTH